MLGEFDKGFLMENDCFAEGVGVGVVRPSRTRSPKKMMDNQAQESPTDTALTQKVGNTRIAVEQANGGAKCLVVTWNTISKLFSLD